MKPIERSLSNWQVAGHPFSLACTSKAVEQLSHYALTPVASQQDPGTLFGKWDGAALTVSSVSDDAATTPANDTRVGWFRVRTEPDIHLTPQDLLYYDEQFPKPYTVGLILRPAVNGSIRVGVFFRESNGSVRAASSYQEVLIAGQVEAHRTALTPAVPAHVVKVSKPAAQDVVKRPTSEITAAPKRRWALPGLAFVVGAIAGILSFGAVQSRSSSAPVPQAPAPLVIPVHTEVRAAVPPVPQAPIVDPALVKRANDLTAQTEQLQKALKAERAHSRLLETTLTILRQRLQVSKPTRRLNSFAKQARPQQHFSSL